MKAIRKQTFRQNSITELHQRLNKAMDFQQALKSSNALDLGIQKNGRTLYLKEETLTKFMETHTHVVGLTGCGKSKFLEHLFRQMVTKLPNASFVLLDPKGDLFNSLKKFCLANNLADRLVLFDPADEQNLIGFDPFKIKQQASFTTFGVVEAIRSCWDMEDFSKTPQMLRWLVNGIYTLVKAGATFLDSPDVFDIADNWKRDYFISKLNLDEEICSEVKREWLNFSRLSLPRRKDDINSSYARIRAFCMHPRLIDILSRKNEVLDMEDIVSQGKILLVNLQRYKLLEPDQAHLLGTLLLNDLVRTVFAKDEEDRKPVYCFLDEAHHFTTRDLIPILEEARAFKLFLILAHQYLDQLGRKDPDVYAAVMKSARTKIVFGDLDNEDLEILVKKLFTNEVNVYRIKDELYSPVFEPVEETRLVPSLSESEADNWSNSSEQTQTEAIGVSIGQSQATTKAKSTTITDSITDTLTNSHASSFGSSETDSLIQATGSSSQYSNSSGMSYDLPFLLEGANSGSYFFSQTQGGGSSACTTRGVNHSTSNMETDSQGFSISNGHAVSVGESEAITEGRNKALAASLAKGESQGETKGGSYTKGRSYTRQPFHAYKKYWTVTKREYQKIEEQFFQFIQFLKGLKKRQFVVKFPEKRPIQLTTPEVNPTPQEKLLTKEQEQKQKEIVYRTGYYANPKEIKKQRQKQLQAWQEEHKSIIELKKEKDSAPQEPKSYRWK